MECRSIEERLSAYIDNVLPPGEKHLVEEHIRDCTGCAGLFEELMKTVEHARGLEPVNPPVWLRQKVMSKVRDEAGKKKGVLRRLFYPLHIKVPLEVVATIAVVLTSVYVFRGIPPQMRPSVSEQAEVSQEEEGGKEAFIQKAAPVPQETLSGKPESGDFAERPAPESVEPRKRALTYSDVLQEPDRVDEMKPGLDVRDHTGRAAPSPARLPGEVLEYSELRSEAERLEFEKQQKSKTLQEGTEPALHYTLSVRERGSALEKLDGLLKSVNAKVIRHETIDQKEVLIVELASDRVDEFDERLREVGEVRVQKPGFEITGGGVRVTIEVEVRTLTR